MYHFILFDLDGTLTDPGEGITNSVAYALKQYGICVNDRSELYRFIGPPLMDGFMEYYGFSEKEAKRAIQLYREYFTDEGIFENQVYDFIPETLYALRQSGCRLAVATSKPMIFAEKILHHFHLAEFFELIAGSELDGSRSKKSEVIAYAIEKLKMQDRSSVIMIGDRKQDIQGARENGLDSIGVLYGYGSRDELEKAGATYLVSNVKEIQDFFTK